ncbi:hypothetical protein HAALTHF_42110n [Vreelandella aquamarina]|nr:hypothetical protein HAALTHF_42110n [Halomonas axialensis]
MLLGVIALGLVGYAVWRTLQALQDTDHHGSGTKGLAIRGGLLVSAVTHTFLAFLPPSLWFISAALAAQEMVLKVRPVG